MTYSNTVYPVVNLANQYINGAQISYASATTLTVQPGIMRDSTNTQDINLGNYLNNYALYNTSAAALTLNFANSGVPNGLDTGTVTVSSWYYIYAISDQSGRNTPAVLASLNTTPLLPAGIYSGQYSNFRLIGYWYVNSSGNLVIGYTAGSGKGRSFFFDTDVSVLAGGAATSLTAISLATGVPAVNGLPVYLDVNYVPATAGDKVSITTFGSTATVLPHVTGQVATIAASGQLKVIETLNNSGVPEILYINSAGSGAATIWVHGFDFYV